MEQRLRELIKQAMVNKKNTGNGLPYQTYKNILEKAQKSAKEAKEVSLSDDRIFEAVKKEIKQLEDTLSFCKPGDGYYESTSACIEIAKQLLPVQVDKDVLMEYLCKLNIEKNMGVCMRALKEHFGSSFDGKSASIVVKEFISTL